MYLNLFREFQQNPAVKANLPQISSWKKNCKIANPSSSRYLRKVVELNIDRIQKFLGPGSKTTCKGY